MELYIPVLDKHGRTVATIPVVPRKLDTLPAKGERIGDLVLVGEMLYVWTGEKWKAASGGITALSELIIDVDKDWKSYVIKNLGAPVDDHDALRKVELDNHKTATPIDHPDGSIPPAKLSVIAAPSDKQYLRYNAGEDKFEWVSDGEFNILKAKSDSVWEQLQFSTPLSDSMIVKDKVAGGDNYLWLQAFADSGYSAVIGLFRKAVDGDARFIICPADDTANVQFEVNAKTGEVKTKDIKPLADNSHDLGNSTTRWRDGYFAGKLGIGVSTIEASRLQIPYEAPNNTALLIGSKDDMGANWFPFGIAVPADTGDWPFGIIKAGTPLFRIDNNGVVHAGKDIIPDNDNAVNLGSSSYRWAYVYAVNVVTGDLTLKSKNAEWRITEKPDGLYVINLRTGVKYKLLMQEV